MTELIVSIPESLIRQCSMLGVERWLAKKGSTDKESYAMGRKNKYLEHDLLNSVRANISEWAVAQEYALGWNGGITYTLASGHINVPSHFWKVVVALPVGNNDLRSKNLNSINILPPIT